MTSSDVVFHMIKNTECVFQSIHVVSVNGPISNVAIAVRLNITNILAHYIPTNVLILLNSLFKHSDLQFTQDLKTK